MIAGRDCQNVIDNRDVAVNLDTTPLEGHVTEQAGKELAAVQDAAVD